MTSAGRLQAAIELLGSIEIDRRPADAVANEFFRARRFIGAGDRREISDNVWSVIRARYRLDWWLDRVGAAATPRLLVFALSILSGSSTNRVAATCGSSRFGPPALEDDERRALAQLDRHTLNHPTMSDNVRLEIPDFVEPLFRAHFGDRLDDECVALMQQAPTDLRVNLLKTTRAAALSALKEEGFDVKPTELSPWGVRLFGRQNVSRSRLFRDGWFEIQDEGSQLVALLARAKPGMRVIDYCAGAGGKTLALAMTMNNHGRITACDVSEHRLSGAIKRLRRANVHNVERHLLVTGDKWVKRQEKKCDVVLVDAPCTGTGTWRRNPDARLRLTTVDLAELVAKQASILDSAQRLVRPGGALVYATCSLLTEEGEEQISAFLERYPEFQLMGVGEMQIGYLNGDALRLTPARNNTDGFFCCRMERKK